MGGTRTDIGMLGSGLYFADASRSDTGIGICEMKWPVLGTFLNKMSG